MKVRALPFEGEIKYYTFVGQRIKSILTRLLLVTMLKLLTFQKPIQTKNAFIRSKTCIGWS